MRNLHKTFKKMSNMKNRNNSLLYIENREICQNFCYIPEIRDYITKRNEPVYVLTAPLTERKYTSQYEKGLIILSPHIKILFLNLQNESDENFNDYFDDTLEDLSSLSDRYGFKEYIGRPRVWKDKLTCKKNLSEINDFGKFLDNPDIQVKAPKEIRDLGIIISLFIGSINSSSRIGSNIPHNVLDMVKYKIQLFDGDQTRFIYDDPPGQKLIRIQGLSGTGKTELLFHKLKDVYISEPDSKIAFTCYSRVLAGSLRKRIPQFFDFMSAQRQIDYTKLFCFHSWGWKSIATSGFYSYICNFYEITFYRYGDVRDFSVACKKAIEEIENLKKIQKTFKFAFQYVFLDESQDFTEDMFKLCELVTEKRVYAAGDFFQNIYSKVDEKELSKVNFLLSNCYRSDPRTFMCAQALGMGLFEQHKISWLTDVSWERCGYIIKKGNTEDDYILTRNPIKRFGEESIDKNCFSIEQTNDVAASISRIIKRLKDEFSNIVPDDICIILLDDKQYIYNLVTQIKKYLFEKHEWKSNIAYETKEKLNDSIFISNYRNVKGLEFPFVICFTLKLEDTLSYRNRLYTMISRSFLRTYLLVPEEDNGFSREIFDGIKDVVDNSIIKTHRPSEKEIKEIEKNIASLKEKSTRDIIIEILKNRGLSLSNVDKVEKFIQMKDDKNLNEDDISEIIDILIEQNVVK